VSIDRTVSDMVSADSAHDMLARPARDHHACSVMSLAGSLITARIKNNEVGRVTRLHEDANSSAAYTFFCTSNQKSINISLERPTSPSNQ